MSVSFAQVGGLWREGERRLLEAEGRERMVLERVVDALVGELRRRLGGAFTTDQLAELYLRDGTEWCLTIAMRIAPADPEAWDVTTVSGAAFARYVRQASDFGGGRRIAAED